MKNKILFLFVILFLQINYVSAQIPSQETVCFQPFSYKFDEFNKTDTDNTKKRLKEFERKISEESNEAKGEIYVYGGRKTGINEITDIISKIKNILNIPEASSGNSKFRVQNGGYRSLPGLELYIKPLNCSKFPGATPDFDVEQVEFAEAPVENTVKKTSFEIADSLIEKTEIVCPPTPTAVGACKNIVEVYVVINQKGEVIFAKAVSGHPLLRVAGEKGVKNWKFAPTKINDKNYNVTGRISVEFKQVYKLSN